MTNYHCTTVFTVHSPQMK